MWHLPSLQEIYSSVFTILQHTCPEQISANPFFSSSGICTVYGPLEIRETNFNNAIMQRRNSQGRSERVVFS